ncbi:unnamed protein product [Heligmosomoides polygyrus]|uniref:Transposable element Tc3 transposase n=1 Tax=Heligmosomoides polygyrus TaxID=6339 RepID=A0A183FE10_HELPZ|nr:unnamed protein product [Heligmosomoides polygyrus]
MRCAPFITAKNRQNQLLFARQTISTDWSKIVWSDEKMFNCDGLGGFRNYWHDLRKEKLFFSKRNFSGGGVMVWAAICSTGRVKLLFVPKKMNSAQYQFALEHGLLRFWRRNSQRNLIFQQDNAPIHRPKKSRDKRQDKDRPLDIIAQYHVQGDPSLHRACCCRLELELRPEFHY